jgi:hypothetical protein
VREGYSGADVRNILEQLGARPVAYHASFARLVGSVTAGVMLSQAFFWTLHNKKTGGWFYKRGVDWETETGLTRSEQETARKRLIIMGLLDEKPKGIPPQLYYRVDNDALAQALSGFERPIDAEELANLYATSLARASALAAARARAVAAFLAKTQPDAAAPQIQKVNYVEVLLREGARCHICRGQIFQGPGRSTRSLSFDHEIPLNRGGSHTSSNVKCAHAGCNAEKGDELPESNELMLFPDEETAPAAADAVAQQTQALSDSNPACSGTADRAAVGQHDVMQGYSVVNRGREKYEENYKNMRAAQHLSSLPLNDGTEYLVLDEDVKFWKMTYPAVDVEQQLRSMRDWCISNRRNRKTRSGIRGFVTRWLSRQQDRAARTPIPSAREQRDTARALEGTRRVGDGEATPQCHHCDAAYEWTARRAATTADADSLYCSDACRDEYAEWKAEAIARGVNLDVIRREKRAARRVKA